MGEHSRPVAERAHVINAKADTLAEMRIVEFARNTLLIGSHFAAFWVLLILRGKLELRSQPMHQHIVSLDIFLSLAVVCMFSKQQPNARIRGIFHAIVLSRLAWTLHVHENGARLLFDQQNVLIARCVLCLVFGPAKLTL